MSDVNAMLNAVVDQAPGFYECNISATVGLPMQPYLLVAQSDVQANYSLRGGWPSS